LFNQRTTGLNSENKGAVGRTSSPHHQFFPSCGLFWNWRCAYCPNWRRNCGHSTWCLFLLANRP